MKETKLQWHSAFVSAMGLDFGPDRADLVIIDDNAAKKTAKYLGLTVTGTLGVLLKAKSKGIVQEIAPLLTEMKRNGFYIDSVVEGFVLKQAGEA